MTPPTEPYRRRTRRWARASALAQFAALTALLLLAASGSLLKAIEAAAPVEGRVDWASIAGLVTFAAIWALAGLAVGILL